MNRKIVLGLISYPMIGIGTISRKTIEGIDKSHRISVRELMRKEQDLGQRDIWAIKESVENPEIQIRYELIPSLLNYELKKLIAIDLIIIDDYPISEEQFKWLQKDLDKQWELRLFMVKLSKAELQKRLNITLAKTRNTDEESENRIRERITEQIEEIEKMSIYMDEVIDASNLKLDELKRIISKRILRIL